MNLGLDDMSYFEENTKAAAMVYYLNIEHIENTFLNSKPNFT